MGLNRIRAKYFFLLIAFAMPFGSAKADLLVTDQTNHSVLRFSNAGVSLGTFIPSGSGGQLDGIPVFGPDGNLYFIDDQGGILRYNGSTGAFIDKFVPAGSGGMLSTGYSFFGPDGNLYVSDYSAHVVRRFNGTTGASMGVFTSGYNLVAAVGSAFGPDGNLYVADEVSIVKFDGTTGAFISVFVAAGSGGLLGPSLLAFRPDGFLYVGSAHSGVLRYNAQTGAFVSQIVPDLGIRADGGLAFGPDGNMYVGFFNFGNPTDFVNSYNPQTGGLITAFFVPPGAAGVIGGIGFTPTNTQVTAVVPNHGGNAGSVTVQVIGGNFQPGAQLKLTGVGPDILGVAVSTVSTSVVSARFDLRGAGVGTRNVVVVNPDSSSAVLAQAFTIEQGGAPLISVNIIGFDKIRFGKSQAYYLQVTNIGSVDSSPGLVSLDIPSLVDFQETSGSDLFAVGSTTTPDVPIPASASIANLSAGAQSNAAQPSGRTTLQFASGGVPAGGTNTALVQLTLPVGASISQFTITGAWQLGLLSLSFNDYLLARGAPYIPFSSSCTQCYNQAVAQVTAITGAQTAYTAYQVAEINKEAAVGKLGVALAQATFDLAFPLEKAISQISDPAFALLATSLLSQSANASAALAGDSASSVLKQLGVSNLALIGKATALLPGVPKDVGTLLTNIISKLEVLNSILSSPNSYVDAVNVAQAARASFFPLFDAYQAARRAYRDCLAQSCGAPPLPLTPPNLPGTTSVTVNGVSSIDPNDKLGLHGAGLQRYLTGIFPLAYSVYFANDDSASAPAQKVVISDQLDTVREDVNTFRFGPIAFGDQSISAPPPGQTDFSTTIDLRPTTNLLVAVRARLNVLSGLLTWTFQSVDPSTGLPPADPTAGFLSPGVGGTTSFTIMSRQGLVTNTQIQNQATIVFDSNAPINTPTWLNTLDSTPPSSHFDTLPAVENSSLFVVQWSGIDVGAGIQDFTIYVSEDAGPFTTFLENTPATSATFQGRDGHTYSFYSLGRDFAGNLEAKSPHVEATTSTPSDSIPPTTFATLSKQPNAVGWNNSDVTVNLTSLDNPGGSGVKQIQWSLSGAQTGSSTVPGSTTTVTISTEGTTILTYFGTDNAGNQENPHSLKVRIDKTPPVVTASVNPSALWPPNGKMVNVTVSGTIMDATSGVNPNSPTFTVIDTYGTVQPSGNVAVSGDGSYSLTLSLEARRSGNDQNGRTYTITVIAQDNAGNQSSASTAVVVPHDQGN